MKKLSLILIFTIVSCGANKFNVKLSEFELNGKSRNQLIVDRIPDYGDGHKDGCIVSAQISLELNYDSGFISGTVLQSDTKEVLPGAQITLISQTDTLKLNANEKGYFKKENSKKIKTVIVEFIGLRNLNVNLK